MRLFDMIKKNLMVNKNELITFTTVPIGAGLVGIIISLILSGLDSKTYVEIASAFSVFGGLFILIFGMIFAERQSFTLAVTMGIARKRYLPARYISLLIEVATVWIGMIIIHGLDTLVGNIVAPGLPHENILTLINIPAYLVVIIMLAIPILCLFLGIFYVRYERKFFWVMWAIWMLFCLGGPRIGTAMANHPESAAAKIGFALQSFFGMNSLVLTGIILVITAIMGFVATRMYKTETITV